ncbi:MAG: tetratricopeptide repeat protein [Bacteroidota bacterium]
MMNIKIIFTRNIIYHFTVSVLFALPFTILNSQVNRVDLFPTNVTENQEIYGNGVLKYLQDGDIHMWKAKYEEAILAYDNAIIHSPNFAEAYLKRGISKFRIGRVEEANDDIEIASRLNPYIADLLGYPNLKSRKNLIALNSRKWLQHFQLQWHVDTYVDQIIEKTDLLYQLQETIDAKDYEAAVAYLEPILNQNDAPFWAIDLGVQIHRLLELDYPYTRHFELLKFNADHPVANLAMSKVQPNSRIDEDMLGHTTYGSLFQLNKAVEAAQLGRLDISLTTLDVLEADYQLSPEEHLFLEALVYKVNNRLPEALASINTGIDSEMEPNADAHLLRGTILLLLNEPYAAIDDFNLAINWSDSYPEAYYSRGLAKLLVNNRSDACYDLELSAEKGFEKGQVKHQYFCAF